MKNKDWISTRKEMPKEYEYVLVTYKPERDTRSVTVASWQRARWSKSGKPVGKPFWNEARGLIRIHVIAWQPLPEPK